MANPLQPLPQYVVARLVDPETRTASGLYIPEKAAEKSSKAVVKAVGKDVKLVKVNDVIVYKNYSGTEFKTGPDEYIIIKEEDILATVK
jgi:chaperonin GroES